MKVEVHSSSSGAGSDENLSSSDLSERSGDHEHDYEDIYLVREESNLKNQQQQQEENNHLLTESNNKDSNNGARSRSRDSGSHSRSGSVSSSTSGNVIVKLTSSPSTNSQKSETTSNCKKMNEFLPKPQKYEKITVKRTTNVNDQEVKQLSQESGMSSASPSDIGNSEEEAEKHKLASRQMSLPPQNNKVNFILHTFFLLIIFIVCSPVCLFIRYQS